MPSRHAAEHLADIIENAERIEHYIDGIGPETFAANGLVRDAVERCLERICEAGHRLGEDAITFMPDQPWADIRGMGNWLRHAYDRIRLDVIWKAVRNDVPGLAADARRALNQLRSGSV